MHPTRNTLRLATIAALSATLLLPVGCHVDTHKNGDGDSNNLSVDTPFGSAHVKTDDAAVLAGLGLTPYPGATRLKERDGDNNAADVNLSFGNFKLGVHAAEFHTADPEDKVLAFYRKDMARYGLVLTCKGSTAVGQPTRTHDGLTCDTDEHNDHSDDLQLRAGSEQHQHIVGLDHDAGGTRIGLVALELPAGLKSHDSHSPHDSHSDGDRE